MIVFIAFISSIAACLASVFMPHARTGKNSIDEFQEFQYTLESITATNPKNKNK